MVKKLKQSPSFRTQHVAHRTYYNTVRKEFVPIVNQDNKLGKEEERIDALSSVVLFFSSPRHNII